jgi:hypothetical protein
MELPETNKSSAADKPENKIKNWMQIRETAAAASPLFKGHPEPHMSYEFVFKSRL